MSYIYEDVGPLDPYEVQGPPQEVRGHISVDSPDFNVSMDDTQDEYEQKDDLKGLFVLFNHEKFPLRKHFRHGSQKDGQDLCDCLSRLRYEVREDLLFNDLKRHEVIDTLIKIAAMDHSKHSSLILVFLTHGDEGGILYCSDGHTITCEEVWSYFTVNNCPGLKGKPKIFIFQACKGDDISTASQPVPVQTDSLPRTEMAKNIYAVPTEADILIAYSTFEGNASFRNYLLGSWFIQELCKNFTAYGRRDDIVTLLTRISKCVAHHYQVAYFKNKEERKDLVQCKQMPCFISTLTKKFYLCKSNERSFILQLCKENKRMLDILEKLEKKMETL